MGGTATTLTGVEVLVMNQARVQTTAAPVPDVAGHVEAGHRARFAAVQKAPAFA